MSNMISGPLFIKAEELCNPAAGFIFSFLSPPPDTICKGDTITLNATYPLANSYTWTPNYNIGSASIATPQVWPHVTTPYIVNISGVSNNLIFNGDFSFGNVGFTSAYTYTTNLWPQATYCIGTNPQTFHSGFSPCVDHTTGTGNMMILNGAGTTNTNIWQQTVPVVPNTNYQFSCWLASVHSSSPAQLQFFVNNVQIGPVFTASATTCLWNMFFNLWNSGTSTSAVIAIRNQNTALSGNDFAIDDVYFAQVVQHTDTHLVIVENPQISLGNDTAICSHDSIILTAGTGFAQYQWSTGATTPSVVAINAGTYWLKVSTDKGCIASDTIQIAGIPAPQIITVNDSVCFGDSAHLSVTSGPGTSFNWSNGVTTSTITVAPTSTTTYTVIVTDSMGCRDTSAATAVIHPLPLVQISPDKTVCRGALTTLDASGGISYLWTPGGQTTPSIIVTPAAPVNNYSVIVTDNNNCIDSATVEITTVGYPEIQITRETDTICRGQSTVLEASGGNTYSWSNGATTPSIIVKPLENTYYMVTVGNSQGGIECRLDTSVMQYVKSCNVIFLPNAICLSDHNNIFRPVGELIWFDEYRLVIYDRWGHQLFISGDFSQGWDGTYKGNPVPEGVYVYDIMVRSGSDPPWRHQGTVTVLW